MIVRIFFSDHISVYSCHTLLMANREYVNDGFLIDTDAHVRLQFPSLAIGLLGRRTGHFTPMWHLRTYLPFDFSLFCFLLFFKIKLKSSQVKCLIPVIRENKIKYFAKSASTKINKNKLHAIFYVTVDLKSIWCSSDNQQSVGLISMGKPKCTVEVSHPDFHCIVVFL